MLRLPRNVAGMARLAAKDTGRYSMLGVRLTETEEEVIIEATDGRRAGILNLGGHLYLEETAGPLLDVSNGAPSAVVEARQFARIVKEAKGGSPRDEARAVLRKDGMTVWVNRSALFDLPALEGRYPRFADVIPSKEPAVAFGVNPTMLAEVLEVAAAIAPEDNQRVILQFWDCNTPISVVSCSPGQRFFGLVMPLSLPGATPAEQKASLQGPPHPHAEPVPEESAEPAETEPEPEKKPKKKSRKKKAAAEAPPAEEPPAPQPEEENGHLDAAE